jgi:hypothetical protein
MQRQRHDWSSVFSSSEVSGKHPPLVTSPHPIGPSASSATLSTVLKGDEVLQNFISSASPRCSEVTWT